MLTALRDGFRSLARNWGLVVLVLVVNLALALLLAAPLALQLERDLTRTGASASMMYGFDFDWWTEWSERQEGVSSTFAPDTFGAGFAFKNLDLLLRGRLPLGVFPEGGDGKAEPRPAREASPPVNPLVLGVGAVYLLVQVFLTGGLLGVFRAPQGGWTFRALIHGSGFYFGRFLRVSLLALGLAGVVFAANIPFARWIDGIASEAVSGRTALALGLGRHALVLLALLFIHMLASFARVIVVREERRSAILALVSSAGFCARNLLATGGQYVVVAVAAVLLLAIWAAFDARFEVTGWKSQLVALAAFQGFLIIRIALRLGLLAGQLELHRARGAGQGAPDRV
jgi:hypothetical protein